MIHLSVSTCNLGNAQPTPECIAEWIPEDGSVEEAMNSRQYPIDTGNARKRPSDFRFAKAGRGKFEFMVIGMQESVFAPNSKNSEEETSAAIGDLNAGCHQPCKDTVFGRATSSSQVTDLVDTAIDAAFDVALEAVKIRNKGMKKLKKQLTPLLKVGGKDFTGTRKSSMGGTKVLDKLIMERCPSYDCLMHYQRGQMRLLLLARKDITKEVKNVKYQAVNTGVASVFPNKGGIVVTFTYGNTRFSFLSAHLAAHEGKEYYETRCQNLDHILEGTQVKVSSQSFDVSVSSHHCFVLGDLNFRVSLGDKFKHEEKMSQVLERVKRKNWAALHARDELSCGIKKGDCLVGFETLPCNFPPSFKVKRQKGFEYNPKRVPSYCDRVLWKSMSGLVGNVKPLVYEPCVDFRSSDHKPIKSAFAIVTNAAPNRDDHYDVPCKVNFTPADRVERSLHLIVDGIRCTDLRKRTGNLNFYGTEKINPFVVFISDPSDLVDRTKAKSLDAETLKTHHGWRRTETLKDDPDPDWGDATVSLKIPDVTSEKLRGACLYITVMNHEIGQHHKNAVLGTVTLNLQRLLGKCDDRVTTSIIMDTGFDDIVSIELDKPLIRNGQERGNLKCSIDVMWLEDSMSEGAFSRRRIRRKSKKGKDACISM